MGKAKTFLLLISASIFCTVYAAKEVREIVVQVPDLGYIKGRTVETLGNLGKPKKSYHNFRNIPFAKSVSHQYRFSVSYLNFANLTCQLIDINHTTLGTSSSKN